MSSMRQAVLQLMLNSSRMPTKSASNANPGVAQSNSPPKQNSSTSRNRMRPPEKKSSSNANTTSSLAGQRSSKAMFTTKNRSKTGTLSKVVNASKRSSPSKPKTIMSISC